jgi:16S rRNA (guanine527-N7)-methyltransferase
MSNPPFHMEHPFPEYGAMLRSVGKRVNLVSAQDLGHLEERHLEPCRQFAQWLKTLHPQNVLDLGSGGGLPGIPVAILNPECKVLLCESVGKKAEFLGRAVSRLKLANTKVYNCRIEDLILDTPPDVVTARFFGTLETIVSLTAALVAQDTRLALIKGDDEDLPETVAGYRLVESVSIGYAKRAVLYAPSAPKPTPESGKGPRP